MNAGTHHLTSVGAAARGDDPADEVGELLALLSLESETVQRLARMASGLQEIQDATFRLSRLDPVAIRQAIQRRGDSLGAVR